MALSSTEIDDLHSAKQLLENPRFAAKLCSVLGAPVENALAKLPQKWGDVVNHATRKSIETALDLALRTLDPTRSERPSNWRHKLAAFASGAAGGALGISAIAVELPISTTIILRSIADIARSEGEDLQTPEGRLQCIQVLALGGPSKTDDATETGYFAARAAMAIAVRQAARQLAEKGLSQKGSPAVVRLIAQIASRFSTVVSEKAAAQAIPVLGAVAGAVINTLFIDHFQDIAKGHFTVRRLERLHGYKEVKRVYEEL